MRTFADRQLIFDHTHVDERILALQEALGPIIKLDTQKMM